MGLAAGPSCSEVAAKRLQSGPDIAGSRWLLFDFGKSRVNRRSQRCSTPWEFATAVEVPILCFVQGAKRTLLGIEVQHVLVLSSDHTYCAVAHRLEGAVLLEILAERYSFAFPLAISV